MATGLNHQQQQQRMQMLLEKRARVDAEIASIQTSNVDQDYSQPPSHGRPSGHRQRRHDVSRSLSHSGPVSRTLSSGRGQLNSVPMSASISQHSAPAMARFGSKSSTSSIPSMPFSNVTGHMPPPLHDRRNNSVLDSYMSHQDDPVNEYTFRSTSKGQPLDQLPELDYGEHPTKYFARTEGAPVLSVTPSPVEAPFTNPWQNPHRLSTSSQRRQSFGIQTPATPSTTTLTIATTASEMSRDNSFCSDGINGPFEMLAVNSNSSLYDNNSFDDTSYHSVNISPSQSKRFSSEEQNLLVTGVGGGSHHSFPLFHSPDSTSQVLSPFDGDMKRSESNESTPSITSSSSSKSRAVVRLQHQNQIASIRPLAPKTENDEMSGSGSTTTGPKSKSGSADPVPITKAPYQRPKHERVMCSQCSEYPEGFRGAHELNRHIDRQHKIYVKKWVCIEPVDGASKVRPINPLSKCKACSNQRKNYGAYYNAAAHLRRAHFKPKPRGRSKSKIEDKSEKRGGKGGGDWPPMNELKLWMKEVQVHVTENQQQADDDGGDDDCEVADYDDVEYNTLSNMTATPTYGSGFTFSDNLDSTMVDAYPQLPTFNTQSISNIPFDSLIPQQTIDSMAYASSQASFDSQLVMMNDPIGSFISDHFPQSYDPSTLADPLNYQTYNPIM